MLSTERAVGSVESPLEDGPYAFYAVGMRHSIHELFGAVIHNCVVKRLDATVGSMLIRKEDGTSFNGVAYLSLNGYRVRRQHDNSLYVASAFPHSKYSDLADRSAPSLQLLRLVFVRLLAAEVRLAGLCDRSEEHTSELHS